MDRSAADTAASGRIIFGGSFNPLHCGHMRLALEALERLKHWANHLEFLPSAVPPHKDAAHMLPFSMRAAMIRKAIAPYPAMSCNEVEASRQGPSYTYTTLADMGGNGELYFLLGSQDFLLLPQWHRGLELLDVANLVVVPRGESNANDFLNQCFQLFGSVELLDPRQVAAGAGAVAARAPNGSKIFWLPVPHLAVSASYVRECWLCGHNVDYLVPVEILEILNREARAARSCWKGESAPCSM